MWQFWNMDKSTSEELLQFLDVIKLTREALGLVDPTPDAIDVTLGVLREFRAFQQRKPKQAASVVAIGSKSVTPAPGGEYADNGAAS